VTSKVRAGFAVFALLGACGLAACVIGPKHDDPDDLPAPGSDAGAEDTSATATPEAGGLDNDAISADTGPFSGADGATPSGDAACGDAGDAACASDGGDAAADAPADASETGDAAKPDALGGD
jgi:hypothetical protein